MLSLYSVGNVYFMYSKKTLITRCTIILYTKKCYKLNYVKNGFLSSEFLFYSC